MGVIFGTNRIRWEKANPTDLFDLVPSWIVATMIAFIANLFLDYLPAELVLIGSVFSLFGFIITRSRTWMMTHFLEQSIIFQKKNELMKERVLIIGLGASAQHTAWLFEHLMNSKLYHIVGFVDNDLTKQGSRYFGSNVIGKWDDIPDLVKKHDVGLLILADYRVDSNAYIALRDICKSTNARFVVMPDILASINHLIKRSSKKTNAEANPIERLDPKCIDCLAHHVNASGLVD
jgi:FlaA1/EpsC-like NDP-sugar epimerase